MISNQQNKDYRVLTNNDVDFLRLNPASTRRDIWQDDHVLTVAARERGAAVAHIRAARLYARAGVLAGAGQTQVHHRLTPCTCHCKVPEFSGSKVKDV